MSELGLKMHYSTRCSMSRFPAALGGPTSSGRFCCSSSSCKPITGVLLMFYYVPSADHAYASTQYIIHEVDYGWFLLSYHFWGSSAMVVWSLRICRRSFSGARIKNRVKWSGWSDWRCSRSSWDLASRAICSRGTSAPIWATTVGVEIMDKTPLIGDFLARFLKGGPTPGQMTLSRFFVIHVMVLPQP